MLRAVEPSDGMRDFWTKTVVNSRSTIVKGTFDDTGVEDGWADVIVVAQVSSESNRNEYSYLRRTGIPLVSGPWESIG
jgi:hypothetical protein